MNPLVVLLRLIHIGCGVYWAGTIFFFATYLEPSIRAVGPDGGKVMIKMFERRYLTVLPVIALLAIASGAWLMWIVSSGFDSVWAGSRLGISLQTGGAIAILAFLIGVTVMRPAAAGIWRIARTLPQADDAARAGLMAEMARLRGRSTTAARVIFGLLLLTVSLMAVARYL